MPVWGFGESPLVDGDKIICAAGGEDGTLMALDKRTGKPVWKCPVPEGPTGDRGFLCTSGAAYSSVMANGKLYLRDQDLLFCYDVHAK
jgi:outer membrane protein assembly factor BamB